MDETIPTKRERGMVVLEFIQTRLDVHARFGVVKDGEEKRELFPLVGIAPPAKYEIEDGTSSVLQR